MFPGGLCSCDVLLLWGGHPPKAKLTLCHEYFYSPANCRMLAVFCLGCISRAPGGGRRAVDESNKGRCGVDRRGIRLSKDRWILGGGGRVLLGARLKRQLLCSVYVFNLFALKREAFYGGPTPPRLKNSSQLTVPPVLQAFISLFPPLNRVGLWSEAVIGPPALPAWHILKQTRSSSWWSCVCRWRVRLKHYNEGGWAFQNDTLRNVNEVGRWEITKQSFKKDVRKSK